MNARFSQSMPDELEKRIAKLAKEKKMSKTAFINQVMADYVGMTDEPGFYTEIIRRIESLEKEVEILKTNKNQ
jgi:predicted DNA-binding protein